MKFISWNVNGLRAARTRPSPCAITSACRSTIPKGAP